MNTTYHPADDILTLRLSDKPIAREISHNGNAYRNHYDSVFTSTGRLTHLLPIRPSCARLAAISLK